MEDLATDSALKITTLAEINEKAYLPIILVCDNFSCPSLGRAPLSKTKKEGDVVARFLVIHDMPPQVTQDQAIQGAKQVTASLAPGAEWLNSWWDAEADRLFCEWEAPDADSVRASLEVASDLLPIEAIHEVQKINPQWYK